MDYNYRRSHKTKQGATTFVGTVSKLLFTVYYFYTITVGTQMRR
jgi:hypothetical protein